MKLDMQAVEVAMAERGWSFTKLAEEVGVARQTISTIRSRGTCKPEVAGRIAQTLGVTATDIAAKEKE